MQLSQISDIELRKKLFKAIGWDPLASNLLTDMARDLSGSTGPSITAEQLWGIIQATTPLTAEQREVFIATLIRVGMLPKQTA